MAATVTTASGASWQEVAADRQRYRDATIAAVSPAVPEIPSPAEIPLNVSEIPRKLLSATEIDITESPVEVLAPKIAAGEWTATEVITAFLRRAGIAQKLTNCITELLPSQALSRAADLDNYLKKHGKPVGPLHGIPISVKEHIGMKGLDLNAGFISWVGRLGEDDSHILKILWKAGAVFYARTTQPQSLMHLETSNNLYGVTTNPFNTSLTSGGSSGGEGALIGLRGSPLGIGSDIGGSIRSSAANNGIYGYKPSTYRLPVLGWDATMGGQEQIVAAIGPLSTSLDGLKLFVKSVLAAQPWLKEPSLLPLAWKDQKVEKKLKVAVLWDDGVVKPHPPVTRALTEVVSKLKAQPDKFEVVEWVPYKHDLCWEIIASLYFSDGAAEEKAAIEASGEPYRPLTDFIIKENPHVKCHTISSVWEATARREAYRLEYAEHWNKTAVSESAMGVPEGAVDVILCPVGPGVAPKLDCSRYWGYTAQWNLLDYPALVFPVSKIDVQKDGGEVEHEPRNEKDEYNWNQWVQHGAEGYRDAPVSLQLVGRRWQDESVFAALDVIKEETGLPFA